MWEAIVASIIANITLVANYESQKRQEKHNMELAQFEAAQNAQLQAEQNAYNAPAAQMQRYQDARLNPNLIYGQGTPGNQPSVIPYPSITPTDQSLDAGLFQAASLANTGRMTSSQVTANKASIGLKTAQTELSKLQAAVIARNPALNDAGYKAMIDGLIATASLKEAQARKEGTIADWQNAVSSEGFAKINREVQLLEQKYKLGEVDRDIKASILKSKDFQNDILEVQKNFMKDGDITPQHIVQFIQMLIMKAM